MTSWVWTCRSCGYEMDKYIGDFTEECPSCKVEYKLLGIAYDMHQLSQRKFRRRINKKEYFNRIRIKIISKTVKVKKWSGGDLNSRPASFSTMEHRSGTSSSQTVSYIHITSGACRAAWLREYCSFDQYFTLPLRNSVIIF
ncbi:MAG: hypothetical protein ACTSQK_03130 [Candidatus Heimdallarchaeota archaeon]